VASCRSDRSSFLARVRALIATIATVLLAAGLVAGTCAQAAEVVAIRQAGYIISSSITVPPADSAWREVALPHREPREGPGSLTPYWYRLEVKLDTPIQDTWLYFPKLRSGGSIYVNGVRIENIRSADHTHQVRWFRPYLFYVPPAVLRQGVNTIAVHFSIREPLTSFGEVFVGPGAPLQALNDEAIFLEITSNRIAAIMCVMSSIFVLALWLRRRQEQLYGLFGLCLMFWGVRTFIFRMPVIPLDWWLLWRFAYYFTTNGFIVVMTLFLLRFAQAPSKTIRTILIYAWLGSLAAFLVIGADLRPAMDSYGTLFYLPFTVYATIRLFSHALRTRDPAAISVLLAIGFALALAMHDFAVQHGLFGLSEYYLLHLGIPFYLLVMGVILLNRFIASLGEIESMNATLSRKVAQREHELMASYQQMRLLQEEQTRSEERQRIMQDIHDGIGSQLLTTLMMVRRGTADAAAVTEMLQACLDDMRLTVDSLAAATPDFAAALGNLRFRAAARLEGLGVTLDWPHQDMPDWFRPLPTDTIKILRILQEALANVLKHADARNVRVLFDASDDGIGIRIIDDGKGFSEAPRSGSYGLNNMRSRAQSLGASFDLSSDGSGTTVSMRIPRVWSEAENAA
jgi:signal transduction histidine kinase